MTGVQTCALPICFPVTIGGVDFTASKIAEMIRSHTQQNKKAAEILRAQMIELDRVKALLDECEKMLWAYQNVGGAERRYRLQSLLHKLKGGD